MLSRKFDAPRGFQSRRFPRKRRQRWRRAAGGTKKADRNKRITDVPFPLADDFPLPALYLLHGPSNEILLTCHSCINISPSKKRGDRQPFPDFIKTLATVSLLIWQIEMKTGLEKETRRNKKMNETEISGGRGNLFDYRPATCHV